MQAKVTIMELRVKLRYKSTSDFGKGDHLIFDKSLAHALEWLYDEDQFEDEHTWFYCMEGVLPIYIMMSIVTDIFTFALQEYAETNIKDYFLRMEEGNDKHGWNDNKPSIIYLGEEIVIGKVHTFTSEVILWATYLYARYRADLEEDNEKLKRAKDVLCKLFWKKTGLKKEFVKDTFLMKHFGKTILYFSNDVLHRYKDDKPVADNKPQQNPVNNKMEDSVLDKITTSNWCFYYEGWRNGKKGGFVQKQGIYRFHEQVRNKGGILDDVHDKEEDNPIVAIGIVAYWLIFNSRKDNVIKRLTSYRVEIPKTMKEQFENYTKVRFEQFKNEHRDDPNTWNWDWEYQFYAKAIIPHEIGLNKQSEALFDYISDSDIALVKAVMKNYIEYLKKCRTEKEYRVSPELLVLRAVDSQDDTKYEDLEDYEIKAILEKLKGEGYIDAMWVHGQKLPWVCKMLDKGRAYLKQLEEGTGVIDVAPVDTPQPSSEQVSTETPSQIIQSDDNSEYDQDVDDEEWDDTYDYIFDEKIKPWELKKALEGIKYSTRISQRRFYYVTYRILDVINYFSDKVTPSDFLRWINLHFNCGWIDDNKHRKQFVFALEGSSKNLEDQHPSDWDEKTIRGGSGKQHHQLAVTLKNTFTETIVNRITVDDSESFEHLWDRGQFLRNAYSVGDGNFFIPDNAYINNGG